MKNFTNTNFVPVAFIAAAGGSSWLGERVQVRL